jgi:D-alanyl-D-alanine carboxypeptidase
MIDYKNYELIKENYTTEENALIVENYPYGFRLKTKIKYWIETKNNKQRLGTQTLNPKSNLWNKPKYSTYNDLILMYKDKETGYIKTRGFNLTYSNEEDLNEFLNFIGDYRNEHINKMLKYAYAIFETRKHIKVTIRTTQFKHKVTGEIKTQLNIFELNDYEEITEEEQDKKQEEIKQDINKLFLVNALNKGLTIQELKNDRVLK